MATRPYDRYSPSLREEAEAFDMQIEERVAHGHVPDLDRCGRNEWFHSNVWRDGAYATLLFGKILAQLQRAIDAHLGRPPGDISVLEIACGPGHMTLELARRGYQVTGIDLSNACIRVACETAEHYRSYPVRAPIYRCGDFMNATFEQPFDVVFFSCALHHFPDTAETLKQVKAILRPSGLFFASEPTRFPLSPGEAAVIHLIRGSLAAAGAFSPPMETLPVNEDQLVDLLTSIRNEFAYVDDSGQNVQSPHDNEAGFDQMYPVLSSEFRELECEFDFCFFDRIVGGLRLSSPEKEAEVARWLALVDRYLCREKAFVPEQFHFVGSKER